MNKVQSPRRPRTSLAPPRPSGGRRFKRIAVTVEIDVPDAWTVGETDDWVTGLFPKTARAECGEQRLVKAAPR